MLEALILPRDYTYASEQIYNLNVFGKNGLHPDNRTKFCHTFSPWDIAQSAVNLYISTALFLVSSSSKQQPVFMRTFRAAVMGA